MSGPSVSVVIPTFNRIDRLRRVLDALAVQTYPADRMQVVVVSDGSTDGTNDFLLSDDVPCRVLTLLQDNAGPAAARNAGLAAASGELVVFVDDDVLPEPNLVATHVDAHVDGTDRVVIGPMLTPPDHVMSPWVAWEQTMLGKQYDALERGGLSATARQFYTGNASMPLRLVQQFDGFDERFRRAEDIELAYRLADHGVEFVYRSDAIGWHYAERSYGGWCDIAFQYGYNDIVISQSADRNLLEMSIIAKFRDSHPIVRAAGRLAVRSPGFRTIVSKAVGRVLRSRDRPGGRAVQRILSIVYAMNYYGGVAHAVGGDRQFRFFIHNWGLDTDPHCLETTSEPFRSHQQRSAGGSAEEPAG
jgi:glycosyltransferase involved in cell wall biosynthesis